MDQSPILIGELTVPMLIGHFFNLILFGVLCVQVFIYFQAFLKDRLWSKCYVAWICFIEILQTILVVIDGIRVFGNGWGDAHALADVGLIWLSVPAMTGISISFTAQIFFIWRIRVLSQARMIPAAAFLVSVVQCVAAIWTGIRAHQIDNFALIQSQTFSHTSVWLGGSATADLIIAGSLVFYMRKSQSTGLASNAMYVKIIRLIIESGSLCALVAVADLGLFLGYQHTNYHLAPAITLSKLYSNSLLAVLNSRRTPLLNSTDSINTFSLLDTPSMDARLRDMAPGGAPQRNAPKRSSWV
ncbi:hypothetical protein BDZ89DRAFT_1065912 [Hymenopellis radicata]|nr:hypothetical protein BDZ89DRAFT_1065912 [Hymenopellis radicata]